MIDDHGSMTVKKMTTIDDLASDFNNYNTSLLSSKPLNLLKSSMNWLKLPAETGLFQIDELKHSDGFLILAEKVLKKCENYIQECLSNERQRKLVQILDDISDEICRVADLAEFVRHINYDQKYKQKAEQAYLLLHGVVQQMNTNVQLYNRAKETLITDVESLDDTDKRILNLFLQDFERCGIQLSDIERQQYIELNDDIQHIIIAFRNNAHKEFNVSLKQLPQKVRTRFDQSSSSFVISSGISNDDDEFVREFYYRTYFSKDNEQEQNLDQLLRKRYELAKLCGFPSYGHRAIENMLLSDPHTIENYLELIMEKIRPYADSDIALMKKFKEIMGSQQPVMPWDVNYLESHFKHHLLKLDSNEYKQFFSLGSCMDGLNLIFNSLFNVNLKKVPTLNGEIWHPSVIKLSVTHPTDGIIGYIYCDLFQRDDKTPIDCQFTIRCGRRLSDDSYQIPITVIHLNLPSSDDKNIPPLITLSMVDNLFHEFGHAMHSVLARTKYQHVSGTRCSTDFAEVPSQWMEYFVYEPRVVEKFAKHYETGKTISYDLLKRLAIGHKCFQAHKIQTQTLCSMFDNSFHKSYPLSQPPVKIYSDLVKKYSTLPYIPETYPYLKFYHLVDYGARFSSYIISKSVVSKIWYDYFANDPLSSTSGERLKNELLSWGGEKNPQELVTKMFDKKKLSIHDMTNAIVDEIKQCEKERNQFLSQI
ncbi:unnamed protein product [Didymodactylos carnosus]|uniref:Peptidase M3A/M3B catalytic domain-containing protein n=1 Tax=Didymodactylos carnosus TaxID=1234261 RepID=A0A813P4K2_9BILA|nr:unnamed protein product [Didymodactylos carnosus]CAF0745838.1 unnamed protein product [Didymodactylos carnosus]CAF3506057.1 unnamed protein product [Didymodactylos carnosus]CAF3524578.1 unnamed protein product [Didymodactylos carnosus]